MELYDYVLKIVFKQYAQLKALPPRAKVRPGRPGRGHVGDA